MSGLKFLRYPIFLFIWALQAQEEFIHYTTANGLPHDKTYQIHEDPKGYIWVGTDDGLVKFNGTDFKTFSLVDGLKSNYVIDIINVDDETLGLATWGAGLHFLKNDSIYRPNLNVEHQALKINRISMVGKDIIAKGNGLYRYRFQRENEYSKLSPVWLREKENWFEKIAVNIDIDNNSLSKFPFNQAKIGDDLFFFQYHFDSYNYRLGILKFGTVALPFPFLRHLRVHDVTAINEDTYLSIAKDTILIHNKERILEKRSFPVKDAILSRYVVGKDSWDIIVYKVENTGFESIAFYNKKNKTYYFNKALNEQIKGLVSDVIIDSNQNFWISTYGNGLFFVPKIKTIIKESLLLDANIVDIRYSDSSLLLLGMNHLYEFHSSRKVGAAYFDEIGLGFYKTSKDTVLINAIGNFNGLNDRKAVFSSNTDKRLFLVNPIYGIAKELKATIPKIDGKHFKNAPDTDYWESVKSFGPYFNNGLKTIRMINDEVWVLNTLNGLHRYNDLFDYQGKIGVATGFSNDRVTDFIQQGEKIWVATINGLNLIEDKNVRSFYTKDGLLSAHVNSLFVDHHGILWIAHQKGFSIYKNEMFYNYTTINGLPSTFVNKIYETPDGTIWITGNKGAVSIDNRKPYEEDKPPKLIVKQKDKSFVFDVIDFSNSQIVSEYKINDGEWEGTASSKLSLENFNYGEYNVRFRTRKQTSNWVNSNIFKVQIVLPWYRTWWAILLGGLLVTTFFLIRIRQISNRNILLKRTISQAEKLEKELGVVRENIAQDFHDELGNKLAGITVLTDLIIEDKDIKKSGVLNKLERVKKDADELYVGIKDFIWTIDSKSDKLNEFVVYLKDFGEDLFDNSGILYLINENIIDKESVKLPNYWNRQLIFLFKEAMTNTLRHSEATKAELLVSLKKNMLEVTFTDNGKGFAIEELKRKSGLLNMEKRVLKIGGTLTIESVNGTTITFIGKIT